MDNFERLKDIKHKLLSVIECEMEDPYEADTEELGDVIDMLKDIEKTMYYCTVIKAMNSEYHTTTPTEGLVTTSEMSGASPHSRKAYMEAKAMHQDKAVHLHALEKYVSELSTDSMEMIQDASPEEKAYLEKKMTTLAVKIGQMK